MSSHQDRIAYDETFEQGKSFGVITCPKCNTKVLYGQHGETRPKYCPRHEKEEFGKILQSEASDLIRDDGEFAVKRIMQELRMPMPPIERKTIQTLVGEVNGV